MSSFSGVRFVLLGFAFFVFVLSLKSVSTIAPPNASDDFKTDSAPFLPHSYFFAGPTCSSSCGCYCTCKSITHFFFNLAACSGEYSLFCGSCNRQFGGGHRRNTLKARLFLQSFLLRYACWTGTRSYLTTTTVSFLFFVSLEMSLFPANFVPFIAVSS